MNDLSINALTTNLNLSAPAVPVTTPENQLQFESALYKKLTEAEAGSEIEAATAGASTITPPASSETTPSPELSGTATPAITGTPITSVTIESSKPIENGTQPLPGRDNQIWTSQELKTDGLA